LPKKLLIAALAATACAFSAIGCTSSRDDEPAVQPGPDPVVGPALLGPLESLLQTLLRLEIIPILFDRMDDVPSTQAEPNGEVTCPRLRGGARRAAPPAVRRAVAHRRGR